MRIGPRPQHCSQAIGIRHDVIALPPSKNFIFKRHFEQEKKAHENWVAARQAERKLNDLQVG
jgi:hypothetical protein